MTATTPRTAPIGVPRASILIPAHNERDVIAQLLRGLDDGRRAFEIVVICNGCTDDTATVAAETCPTATIVEIPEPSKRAAIACGTRASTVYPRLIVDADVEIDADSVEALVKVLESPRIHAAAPQRVIPMEGVSVIVRWYYDVWTRLPQVESGLFGRGVIALSAIGSDRVAGLPSVLGDDLAASEAFEDHERMIVESSQVIVWPPRTMSDLLRRRIRVATGNSEADRVGVRRPGSATRRHMLVALLRKHPAMAHKIALFVAIGALTRLLAHRAIATGDTSTWQRDDSSRDARRGQSASTSEPTAVTPRPDTSIP